jgi:hypothetical protein
MVALGPRRHPDQPLETPADLLTGSGVRPAVPKPPAAASADPFGLNRASRRSGSRNPTGGRPFSGPPARDSDHSVPTDDQPTPDQDVKSSEPEAGDPSPTRDGAFGGFRLGGTGRFLFGSRNPVAGDKPAGTGEESSETASSATSEDSAPPETAPDDAPVAEVVEPGDSLGAEKPDGDEPAGATPADEPVVETPRGADQDAADGAGPSDENGREDMNGRAGAPGYAQTGEASGPDGSTAPAKPGDAGEETPSPDGTPRTAAGWATVPSANHPVTPSSASPVSGRPVSGGPGTGGSGLGGSGLGGPVSGGPGLSGPVSGGPGLGGPVPNGKLPGGQVSGGPVPGAPVSPGFAYPPVPNFTPDHPAVTLEPVSGAPLAAGPLAEVAETPAEPSPAPTSGAAVSSATAAAIQFPTVQIPATRTPPDLAVERATEPAPAPPANDPAFGFTPSGYSLGRSGEAFGVASVTPAAPGAGSVTPPPADFPSFPFPDVTGHAVGNARRGFEDDEALAPRRSASLEDLEPVRRPGRRSAGEEIADEAEITRTVWDEDAARHFRAAWHEVKAEFVDDPVNALTRAHDLLTDAVNELTEVLLAERDDLDPLRGTDTPDTESMRMAMRNYREFLERILSL